TPRSTLGMSGRSSIGFMQPLIFCCPDTTVIGLQAEVLPSRLSAKPAAEVSTLLKRSTAFWIRMTSGSWSVLGTVKLREKLFVPPGPLTVAVAVKESPGSGWMRTLFWREPLAISPVTAGAFPPKVHLTVSAWPATATLRTIASLRLKVSAGVIAAGWGGGGGGGGG